jgi:hypothetical protein
MEMRAEQSAVLVCGYSYNKYSWYFRNNLSILLPEKE